MIFPIVFSLACVQAIVLKFRVSPGQQQCIKDSVAQNTLIYGNFEANLLSYSFTLSVINQNEVETQIEETNSVSNYQFHHVMAESGEISMCFEVNDYTEVTTFQLFYDSGAEIYDYDHLAKKQHVFSINESLNLMEQLQQDISREQLLIVDRENSRKQSFTDIQSKIIGFAGITFGLLIIVAACQVIYVRRFLVYKKLN